MKKPLLLLVAVAIISACSNASNTDNNTTEKPIESTIDPSEKLYNTIKLSFESEDYLNVEFKYATFIRQFPSSKYLSEITDMYNESLKINDALELEQEGDGKVAKVPLEIKTVDDKLKRNNGDAEPYMIYFSSSRSDFARLVKSNLNDPDSFKFVETKYRDNGDGTIALIMEFRAKNALGGVITSNATAEFSKANKKFKDLVIN